MNSFKQEKWGIGFLSLVIISTFIFTKSWILPQDAGSQLAQVSGALTPQFVQGKMNKSWNATSLSVAFDTNVTYGSVLPFSIKWESSSATLNSVTATCARDAFTLVDNPITYSSTRVVSQGYGIVSTSGPCTITATFSGPAGGWVMLIAHEVKGIDPSNPLDGHTSNKQDNAGTVLDAVTSGNVTTTVDGDYIFGAVWEGGANAPVYSAGSGFTKRISADGTGGGSTEDKIQSTAGSTAAIFTQSVAWAHSVTSVMAFRPGNGNTLPPPPPTEPAPEATTTAPVSTPVTPPVVPPAEPPPLTTCSGSPLASGLISPCRSIDWGSVGIPGGIPTRTTICATISPGASETTIQNALNSCPANQVVQLGEGRYALTKLSVPSNVTLRGAGPQKTILNATGSGTGFITFGTPVNPRIANSVAITGGATAGSRTLVLSSAQGISVGSYLMISQLNDPNYVTITTSNGTCTWCDGGIGWNGTRVQGQIVEVVSVNGTTVGISQGLYIDYTLTPLATPFSMGAKYAGVEDLQVYMNNSGYTTNFYMSGVAYSWIKNIESNYTDGDHARVLWGYRNEIRDSYFHDAYHHTPGSTDANIFIADKSSGTLVENNALRRLHVSIMLNWGASGNVIAYNYLDNNFDATGYNTLFAGLSLHGAHPMFNLWEGNIAQKLDADFFWGSSSHNTAFRNWFKGATLIIPPLTGRAPEDMAQSYWAPYGLVSVDLSAPSRYYNLLGNMIGSDRQKSFTKWTPQIACPESRMYYSGNNFFGYSFGYGGLTDQGAGPDCTPLVRSTTLIHGDYDYVKNSFTWDPAISNHTLPASFYLSSKPSWFGSLSWPAFGPSSSGSPILGNIPAKYCFDAQQMPSCLSSSFVPSVPKPAAQGDFNKDGVVNSLDLSLLASAWNQNNAVYDLNKDGTVNTLDFTIMVKNWTI